MTIDPATLPFAVEPGRPVLVSHALCPYVQRAAIALAEKDQAFLRVDIDLERKPAWFAAVSPLGKTPVLLVAHDDAVVALFESAVIAEYLDETVAPRLHPPEALERARHRAWVEFASATLDLIWRLYTAPDEAALAQHTQSLQQRLRQLDAALDPCGPWFGGEAFSLVDAAFAPVFRYLDLFETLLPVDWLAQAPRAAAWRRALGQRASVRAAVAPDYPQRLRAYVARQRGPLAERAGAAMAAS
ncbi:glutathione S-transferase family protein [Caldimonas sp. KR1-144]|uniref:glutathione S-transferase family protein n=1 Tax=Caldimonas sp. KR1-144 TaxID=3400911 RepID=UPI003C03F1CA